MESIDALNGCLNKILGYVYLAAVAVASWGSAVLLRPTSVRWNTHPFDSFDFALASVQWALVFSLVLTFAAIAAVCWMVVGPKKTWIQPLAMVMTVAWLVACYYSLVVNDLIVQVLWPDVHDPPDPGPLIFLVVEWGLVVATAYLVYPVLTNE
jgi:hypothetical protein